MRPGETDANKKTIYFKVFDVDGLPCSGEVDEAAVWVPGAGEIQVNRDQAGYTNTAGTFNHIADGDYYYTFANAEISGATEGTILFRAKEVGVIRTQTVIVPLRFDTDDVAADVGDVAADVIAMQTDVDAISGAQAIIMGLMHRNAVIDNHTYDLTTGECLSARVRVFADETAAGAAVTGAADDADGEILRFLMTAALDINGQVERYQYVSDP